MLKFQNFIYKSLFHSAAALVFCLFTQGASATWFETSEVVSSRLDIPEPANYTPIPGRGTPVSKPLNYSPAPLRQPPVIPAPISSYSGAAMPCGNPQGDFQCMACNCFNEATANNPDDQLAVSKVVMTRLRLPQYPQNKRMPRTVCGIIKDPRQFSWFNQMRSRRTVPRGHGCFRAATEALEFKGYFADHYHATYVRPSWRRTMREVTRKGVHIYYQKYRSSFRPPAN